jgi:hypothetical protein
MNPSIHKRPLKDAHPHIPHQARTTKPCPKATFYKAQPTRPYATKYVQDQNALHAPGRSMSTIQESSDYIYKFGAVRSGSRPCTSQIHWERTRSGGACPSVCRSSIRVCAPSCSVKSKSRCPSHQHAGHIHKNAVNAELHAGPMPQSRTKTKRCQEDASHHDDTVFPSQSGIVTPFFRFRFTSMRPHLSSHSFPLVLYVIFQGSSKAENLHNELVKIVSLLQYTYQK